MAATNVDRVVLTANLTRDAKLRTTPPGERRPDASGGRRPRRSRRSRRRSEGVIIILTTMTQRADIGQRGSTHGQRTCNTPDAIAEHRRMTPEERFHKAVQLSRAALRFARAPRVDGR